MILVVTPAQPFSDSGNGVTARRWAGILRGLGHRVVVSQRYQRGQHLASALVALHAQKSADSIRAFRTDHPDAPIVLALTGTDLYPDLMTTGVDPAVLDLATRFVVLQPQALAQLDPARRDRARVIIQSVPAIPRQPYRLDRFEIAYMAHLRPVKDPLRLAAAVRLLPETSRITVSHAGAAYDDETAATATAESATNPRYEWLGPLPRSEALNLVARSRLLVLTSWHEGGANVISEALAAGTPVVSSAIPGSVGLLGADYPGYFQAGDAADLAAKLMVVETDQDSYRDLHNRCVALRSLVDPAREREAWSSLLAELELPVPV